MKVLIIDDSLTNQKILSMVLSVGGHDIKTLNDCEGLDLDNKSRVDLLLISNKFVDKFESLGNYKIVAISMTPSIEDLVYAYSAGINDYIILPMSSDRIRARISEAVQAKKPLEEILESMHTIQTKDNSSYKHLERIKMYARLLAEEIKTSFVNLKLEDSFIKNIEIASALHDIGKANIADKILQKPDVFTDKEFEQIKEHTTFGYKILNKIKNTPFIEMAKDIVLFHHEKYDGSGYPHKKSGDEIPLSAKIIALCDVYDALRETRAYKSSVSHDKSVEIIKGGSKTHFDPIVIKAFEKIHQKFDEIFKNFSLGYGLREENE